MTIDEFNQEIEKSIFDKKCRTITGEDFDTQVSIFTTTPIPYFCKRGSEIL